MAHSPNLAHWVRKIADAQSNLVVEENLEMRNRITRKTGNFAANIVTKESRMKIEEKIRIRNSLNHNFHSNPFSKK
jgi:hypothetical protein